MIPLLREQFNPVETDGKFVLYDNVLDVMHPGFYCRVVADSLNGSNRLTTLELRFPRQILAEFNTHRMISKNSASSRARPLSTVIDGLRTDPYIPLRWDLHNKGMQSNQFINPLSQKHKEVTKTWFESIRSAVDSTMALMEHGLHKQTVNRVLEPFMMHTCIASATSWKNFLHQRMGDGAAPAIWGVAVLVDKALKCSTPNVLHQSETHLPYVTDLEKKSYTKHDCVKMSVGRCANISFKDPWDADRDPSADMLRTDRLVEGGHWSPFEHVASAADPDSWYANFKGWSQSRHVFENQVGYDSRI